MGEDLESHKIMAMEPQKRDRVINAAMKEFTKGFKDACTDTIVREAGISKGLLFHYFGTKEKLYSFILQNASDIMYSEYYSLINYQQQDIIEKIWQMTLLKMDLSFKHPALFDFFVAAYNHWQSNPNDEFAEFFKNMKADLIGQVMKNIDRSLFKEGIDPDKAANIILWTLYGYSNTQVLGKAQIEDYQKEYQRYLDEIKEYFTILRETLYK